jgi:hypothetical protein
MHFFQDSLSEATLSWYIRLDNTKIHRWKDLVDAFIKQYKYSMDIALDRTSLSNLKKKGQGKHKGIHIEIEKFSGTGATPLLDKEIVTLFANTLKASYYEHVMGRSTQQFTDVVVAAERIEQGVKSGRVFQPRRKRVLK